MDRAQYTEFIEKLKKALEANHPWYYLNDTLSQFEKIIKLELMAELNVETQKADLIKNLAKRLKECQRSRDYFENQSKERGAELRAAQAEQPTREENIAKIRYQDERIRNQRQALQNLELTNAKLRGQLHMVENSVLTQLLKKERQKNDDLSLSVERLTQALGHYIETDPSRSISLTPAKNQNKIT